VPAAGLTLRAGPGYRPKFLLAQGGGIRVEQGPLTLDGCDFRFLGKEDKLAGSGPWEIRNCRLVSFQGLDYSGPRLPLADSLVFTGRPHRFGPKSEVELTNNLFRTELVSLIEFAPPGRQIVRARNNTFFMLSWRTAGLAVVPASAASIQIEASNNIFQLEGVGAFLNGPDWKDHVRWQGRANLYVGRLRPESENEAKPLTPPSEEDGSKMAERLLFQWRWLRRQPPETALAALRHVTDDLRARHRLDDFGPSCDLIGPGEAYVRALAAEGRPVAADQIRPPPVNEGRFVVLRAGQAVHGCVSLQEVADRARDGDSIQIRTDGFFPGPKFTGNNRRLTVKAGPGYRRVLDSDSLRIVSDRLAIEGIHFNDDNRFGATMDWAVTEGYLERLANCSFSNGLYCSVVARWQGANDQPAEIVNCYFNRGIAATLPARTRLKVRNSVASFLIVPEVVEQKRRVELDHCILWSGDPFAWHDFCALGFYWKPRRSVALEAHATLFEANDTLVENLDFLASWKGSGNVFRVMNPCWEGTDNPRDLPRLAGLRDWQGRWMSDQDAVAEEPLNFDPLAWRLPPESPCYHAGPGGRDFGADVDRVARVMPAEPQ
jgi:hypothetical protein